MRNFDRFQHYKERRPPWIKLYRDLWGDPRFFELSEADRYVLISLFMLASQHDNKIPYNIAWLQRELATRRNLSLSLTTLLQTEWLAWCEHDASNVIAPVVLADCKQKSILETETETDPPNPLAGAFEKVWARYPNRVGKKAAQRHFNASVSTEKDVEDINRALQNYIDTRTLENACRFNRNQDQIPWQNGSTWFNNWRDWIDREPPQNVTGRPVARGADKDIWV